jgi:integrase
MKPGELREHLEGYLALRRAVGFEMRAEERLLRDFVTFVEEHEPTGTIRARLALDWACSKAPQCGGGWQARRLTVARGFLAFLKASHPATEVPAPGLLGSAVRSKPYVFTEQEIHALISAARCLGPARSLRPHTVETLIGLLVSTGLRVSEAIRLQLGDVLLETDLPRLEVRQTKFRKSRLVPLHHTTVKAIRGYIGRRQALGYDGLCNAFFVSERSGPLTYGAVKGTFGTLIRRLGICGLAGERKPSLHSLRHTFAVWRLVAWYREGADVQARLPELSVYLGHVRPRDTYWYLTATPHLLGTAAMLFEEYADSGEMK